MRFRHLFLAGQMKRHCLLPVNGKQRPNGCCLRVPTSKGRVVSTGASASSPSANAPQRKNSARSVHMHPNPTKLLEELCDCVDQGNAVLAELEQFKGTDGGTSWLKQFPVDVSEAKKGSGAERDRLEQFVRVAKEQHELAKRMEKIVPCLFEELCSRSAHLDEEEEGECPSERLLCRGISKLLEIVVQFDTLKTTTPALQNAFSLYRRMSALDRDIGFSLLHAHQADQISLFFARPTPLLTSLVNGVERFLRRHAKRELAMSHLAASLLLIFNLLRHMVERTRFSESKTQDKKGAECPALPFLRSMVGLLLLFDHVDPKGAFCAHSPFDIVQFVEMVIQNTGPNEERHLLDTLRFFSKHFQSPETSACVRAMFKR